MRSVRAKMRLAGARGTLEAFGLCLALAGILNAGAADAADGLRPGEAYITRFSGTKSEGSRTLIDTGGAIGSIVDLRNPAQAPKGQRSNVSQRNVVTAGEAGQVFGVALDDANPPNVYLTATSAFGLHRTPSNEDWMPGMWGPGGGPGTIWKLDPANNYRPKVFAAITLHGRANTGPALGNIAYDQWNKQFYVSDLETGMIHRVGLDGTDLGHFDHGTTGRAAFTDAVTGVPGSLPLVAFDPSSAAKVKDCPFGDFSKTPECWNFADFRRRVWGLGVRRDPVTGDVRLYYAIWGSEGFGNSAWSAAGDDQRNSVWSVRIGDDGSFDDASVRREFVVPNFFADPSQIARFGASQPIASIAFPKFADQSIMLLAERGGARSPGLDAEAPLSRLHESRVLRYELNAQGVWQEDGRYDVGRYDRTKEGPPYLRANASGGVAFGLGYGPGWKADQAATDQFVWMTGDGLCSLQGPCFDPATGGVTDTMHVDGIQGTPAGLINELEPDAALNPYPAQGYATPDTVVAGSYMIDGLVGPTPNVPPSIGAIAVYQEPPPGYVPPEAWISPPGWIPPPGWTPPPWLPLPAGMDIEIKKVPQSATCTWNTTCKFQITINIKTAQIYAGPLHIVDTMPKGWTFVSATSPWMCNQQGSQLFCTYAAATTGTVVFEIELQPIAALGPAQTEFENCAEIDWKGGPGDVNKLNDKACAKVTITPFDLEITKAFSVGGGAGPGAGMLMTCSPPAPCKFQITITNKGPGTFSGVLDVRDTVPEGWKLVSAGGPWACVQQGDALGCTGAQQTTLTPNQSATLDLELQPAPGPGGVSVQVENCAEIDWKSGVGDSNKANDRACEKIGSAISDLEIWKSGPNECTRGQMCVYSIEIKNIGDGPYQGPIIIEDDYYPGLALHNSTLTGCKIMTPGRIECDLGSITIPPHASATGNLALGLPPDLAPALDRLKDCAKLAKSSGMVSKAESCIYTDLTAQFDLKVTKQGPDKCAYDNACGPFTISVENNGPADYEGPISISDTLEGYYPDPRLDFYLPKSEWSCVEKRYLTVTGSGASESRCDHPWIKLPAHGQPLTLNLYFNKPGPELQDKVIKDCAKVHYKGGKPDANPSNDEACAMTAVEKPGVLSGGAGDQWYLTLIPGGMLVCIPTSLAGVGAQGGSCTDYEFAIVNSGPATYSLPMTLRIKLPEGSELRSAQGSQSGKTCPASGWSCEPSGDEIACRPSACSLARDEKTAVHFDVSLLPRSPPEPPPPEGTTKTVCGELEWVAPPRKSIDIEQGKGAGIEQRGDKIYSRGCVTTTILWKKPTTSPEKFDLALQKLGPRECSPGDRCSYSLTIRNTGQASFAGRIQITDTLPAGWKLSSSGYARCTQQGDALSCDRPARVLEPGWTDTIRLEVLIPAQEKRDEVENCASLNYAGGQADADAANDKSCVTTTLIRAGATEVSPETKCGSGERWDRTKKRCVPRCTAGHVWTGKACVCPAGTVERRGECVRPAPAPVCIGGTVHDGKCLCPVGQELRRVAANAFRCVPVMVPVIPEAVPVAPVCAGGTIHDGKCVCPTGQEPRQVGAKAFRCVPSQPPQGAQPELMQPELKIVPGTRRPLCPQGTSWNEQYKKCLPVLQ